MQVFAAAAVDAAVVAVVAVVEVVVVAVVEVVVGAGVGAELVSMIAGGATKCNGGGGHNRLDRNVAVYLFASGSSCNRLCVHLADTSVLLCVFYARASRGVCTKFLALCKRAYTCKLVEGTSAHLFTVSSTAASVAYFEKERRFCKSRSEEGGKRNDLGDGCGHGVGVYRYARAGRTAAAVDEATIEKVPAALAPALPANGPAELIEVKIDANVRRVSQMTDMDNNNTSLAYSTVDMFEDDDLETLAALTKMREVTMI